ncbi:MAG: hypothetical protein LBK53_05760 [Heliobacteriaceae bacterium]|jgi:hypothetical protein|nr:hypothetical protein [Heliobacteriaceae bacterium]
MLVVNPIKLNNPVVFKESSSNNLTPSAAILALQTPGAKLKFEKDYRLTQNADVVQRNSLLGILNAVKNKFVKAYNIAAPRKAPEEVSFVA